MFDAPKNREQGLNAKPLASSGTGDPGSRVPPGKLNPSQEEEKQTLEGGGVGDPGSRIPP